MLYCHAIRHNSVREVLTHHPDAAGSLSDDNTVLLCRLANVAKRRNDEETPMPCRHCIRAESRRVFAVHTSRMQAGVFTCRGHQPMLETRPFGAVGVASFEGSKFTVVVRVSSAHLCRQWPSAHPDSARYAQLIMLDRFASELPTSMWKPRRVQCLPGFVITIEITLLEIASKSRCYSWLPRFTTRGSSSRDP